MTMLGKPSGPDHLRAWLFRAALRSVGVYVVTYVLVAAALGVMAWQGDPQARETAWILFVLATLVSLVAGPATAGVTALIALGLYPLGWHLPAPMFRLLAVVVLPLGFAALTAIVRPERPLLVLAAVVALLVAAVLPHPGRYRRTDADLLQAWRLEG